MTTTETVINQGNVDKQNFFNIKNFDGNINIEVSIEEYIKLGNFIDLNRRSEGTTSKQNLLFLENLSKKYYNLFVTEEETYTKNTFTILKNLALTKYIHPELKRKYATLHTTEIISEIKTFPALFMNENEFFGVANKNQMAYYGIVQDIEIRSFGIEISFFLLNALSQTKLNKVSSLLGLEDKKGRPELNYTHWTIKKIDLRKALKASGFKIFDTA